jgi:hypothetical protein
MSYCDWSKSDICLHPATDGSIICCSCQLINDKPVNRTFLSRYKTLAHVQTHLAFGDNIPASVIERLLKEISKYGDNTQRRENEYTGRFKRNV